MHETATARHCLECRTALQPLQVVERGHLNRQLGELRYAVGEAQPRRFLGMAVTGDVPLVGSLRAWSCPDCGRVQFYAVPDTGPGEIVPAAEPAGRGDEPAP